jgi:hypothetical protein
MLEMEKDISQVLTIRCEGIQLTCSSHVVPVICSHVFHLLIISGAQLTIHCMLLDGLYYCKLQLVFLH